MSISKSTKATISVKNWSYLAEYKQLAQEISAAVQGVFSSGRLILGPHVAQFESDFSKYCGRSFGIGVNSGTDALFLALKALGVGSGDEVITVAHTAVPTVAAIRATGAVPRFIDIEEKTYLMDASQIEKVLSPKTKAIVPVHLYGHAVDMDPIRDIAKRNKLHLVEDCAQSHGCRYKGAMTGSLGDIGAFSFYPTKILGAYGDAGMCITDSEDLAQRLRQLRMYGMREDYYSHREGYNSRLDEVQAAILSVKLKYLDRMITRRQQIAQRYSDGLHDHVVIPTIESYSNHAFYLYVIRHPQRDWLLKELEERGIECGIHFPYPIHLMEAYRFLGLKPGDLPVTERIAKEIISLPMYPSLHDEEVEYVIKNVRQIVG